MSLATLFSGCVLKYEDVSKEPEYSPLLNTYYSLGTNMLIQGVNMDIGYGKDIDVYIVKPISMRTAGPEIITNDILKPGTVLEVKRVERSTSSIPFEGRRIIATVEVDPFKKVVKVPVEIDLEYLQSTNYMNKLEQGTDN
jgi:hypothetical protein